MRLFSNDLLLFCTSSILAALPDGQGVQAFAQLWQDGGEESLDNFELVNSTFNPGTKTIQLSLIKEVLTNKRRSDGKFEVIITLASTPGTRAASIVSVINQNPVIKADTCQASSLGSPVNGTPKVSGTPPRHFNPGGGPHPITGQTTPHRGVDLQAGNGDAILATANGTVEVAGYQYNSTKKTGWGHYIILRHDDGSATLYAHLKKDSLVAKGTKVQKGVKVAEADSSGGVTGPHLHLEYAPNGQIYNNQSKVDPLPCIGTQVQGSITVRDNGSVADDAFAVYLDNLKLGETTIGGSNTFAASNLKSGPHTLKIVAVIAPDNVGTVEVRLSSGVTFEGGSTTQSATMTQGAAVSYKIIVPSR